MYSALGEARLHLEDLLGAVRAFSKVWDPVLRPLCNAQLSQELTFTCDRAEGLMGGGLSSQAAVLLHAVVAAGAEVPEEGGVQGVLGRAWLLLAYCANHAGDSSTVEVRARQCLLALHAVPGEEAEGWRAQARGLLPETGEEGATPEKESARGEEGDTRDDKENSSRHPGAVLRGGARDEKEHAIRSLGALLNMRMDSAP